jgi:hypothetical protein
VTAMRLFAKNSAAASLIVDIVPPSRGDALN